MDDPRHRVLVDGAHAKDVRREADLVTLQDALD